MRIWSIGKCLAVRANPCQTASDFAFVDCSQADDDSQVTQFFELPFRKYITDSNRKKMLNARTFIEFLGMTEANYDHNADQAPLVYKYNFTCARHWQPSDLINGATN